MCIIMLSFTEKGLVELCIVSLFSFVYSLSAAEYISAHYFLEMC